VSASLFPELHVEKSADISEDGLYRYSLTRLWGDWDGPRLCWVMLNPSTADHEVDDPTIRRCTAFSQAWGYHSLTVVNLFALRATDPKVLLVPPCNPVGPANDTAIELAVLQSTDVIAAWGTKGTIRERDYAVTRLITHKARMPLSCLALTKDGHPKHPLYVKGDTVPMSFAAPKAVSA
jgi:hypothetical protein